MVVKSIFYILVFCCSVLLNVVTLKAQTVTYVIGGETTSDVLISSMSSGQIKDATEIYLAGAWTSDQLGKFKQVIKNNGSITGTNSVLQKVDMSGITSLSGAFTGIYSGNPSFSYMFNRCTALKEVIFARAIPPGSVALANMFYECSALETIINLDAFTNISNMSRTFQNCRSLVNVSLPTTNGHSSSIAFEYAFYGCNNLLSIDISAFTNVSSFENSFYGCRSLKSIKMPSSNSYSGVNLKLFFYGCTSLETGVDLSGFDKISSMEEAFRNCSALTTISLPSINSHSGSVSFKHAFNGCTKLTSIDMSGFTSISNMEGIFNNCSVLESVNFPTSNSYSSSVSFANSFYGCSFLTSIDIAGFNSISDMQNVFRDCTRLNTVFLPSSNNYSGPVSFSYSFNACVSLTSNIDLDAFTNISNLSHTFTGCKLVNDIRLGTDPNNVEDVSTTFLNANSSCLKWLPIGVEDIPQTWISEYNNGSNTSYNNFVLPLKIGDITTPDALLTGCTLNLVHPTVSESYSARVTSIWQISPDQNFEDDVVEITSETVITFDYAGYYLRFGVLSPNGITYWSNNAAKITIFGLEITNGSYSINIKLADSLLDHNVAVKDLSGNSLYCSENIIDNLFIYRFTQCLPNTTYIVSIDDTYEEIIKTDPVPTYVAVSGDYDVSNNYENVVVNIDDYLNLPTKTTFYNLLTNVSSDDTYKNRSSTVINSKPIIVKDGLLVNVDMTTCNDQWAYMTMPFDFDVTTGIRYQTKADISAGTESLAVPETHVYISRYNPASRAVNGEGTGNWSVVTSGIIKAGEGFIFAKEADYAHSYKIVALDPNSFNAADKEITICYNSPGIGRTDWDANWNFIGNPFPTEYNYQPQGNAPKFLYRKNNGKWAGGYEINYDPIDGGEILYPHTSYLTQVWGGSTTMNLKVDGSSASLIAAKTLGDRNAFALDLYMGNTLVDKVGWIFTPESSRDIVNNEDAIKARIAKNSMWIPFADKNLVYNNLPFEGDRMNFMFNINADANSAAYRINMRSSTSQDFDIYIRESNSNLWHNLNFFDYVLSASTSSATRQFEVSIYKSGVVTANPTQQSSNVIVYSNNGVIFVDGLSSMDVVSVYSSSGLKLAEYSNRTQLQITDLTVGSFIVKVQSENEVVTHKVINRCN